MKVCRLTWVLLGLFACGAEVSLGSLGDRDAGPADSGAIDDRDATMEGSPPPTSDAGELPEIVQFDPNAPAADAPPPWDGDGAIID